jgi:hypothetical protein
LTYSGVPPPNYSPNLALAPFYVSFGQWVAGQSWSAYWVPCNCSGGYCYNWCTIASVAVQWNGIPAAAACDPLSLVYKFWSGPLGYCSFPSNFSEPSVTPAPISPPPASVTGIEYYGNVPAGTTFKIPNQATSMQALTIIATVTCFLAIVLGCVDATRSKRRIVVAGFSVFCTLLSWVFCLAAVCLWTTFPYVSKVVSYPPSVYVPIWVDVNSNYMSVVQVKNMWYGPAWGTIVTATVLTFLVNLVQCASLKDMDTSDDAVNISLFKDELPQPGSAFAQPVYPSATAPVPSGAPLVTQPVMPGPTDMENV